MNVQNLGPGFYSVKVFDYNGCTDSIFVTINTTQDLEFIATYNNPTCGEANGSATLTVNSGTAPFTFDWDHIPGSNNAQNLTNLSPGTYSVIVTDAAGCFDSTYFMLTNIGPPSLSFDSSTNETCSSSNGNINITVTGHSSITWNNGANTEDINNLSAGTYYVTATNNICEVVDSFTIIDIIGPTLSATPTHSSCNLSNGAIDLIVNDGTPPFTYDWNHIPGSDDSMNVSNLVAGSYFVTVSDSNGCTDSVSVTINTTPDLEFIANYDHPTCSDTNGSISLTVNSGTAPYTFDWDHIVGSNNAQNLTNLSPGTYSVTVSDAAGCFDSTSFILTNLGPPSLSFDSSTNETCSSSNGSINITITGDSSITWSNGANTEDINNLSAGTYYVTATNNICEVVDSFTINDINGPSLSAIPTHSSCNFSNGAIDLIVNDGTPPFTYDWDHIAGSNDSMNISNLTAGSYFVTVSDSNGCTDSVSVTINTTPDLEFEIIKSNEKCSADDGSLEVITTSGTPPFSYSWIETSSNLSYNTSLIENLDSGTYFIRVIDANGCQDSLDIILEDEVSPAIQSVLSHSTDCDDDNGSIDLSVTNGKIPFTFTWSRNGIAIPNSNIEDLSNLSPANYAVTLTDNNGCSVSDSFQIHQDNIPSLNVIPINRNTCDESNSIFLTVSGGLPPFSFNWSKDGVPNFSFYEDIDSLDSGLYQVEVTDANGCVYSGTEVEILEIPYPQISDSLVMPTCNTSNGEIFISIDDDSLTTPYTIEWSDLSGNNQPFIRSGLNSGQYEVTVFNGLNCSRTLVIDLIPEFILEVTATPTDGECSNDNGRIDIEILGTGPYEYSWSKNGISDYSNDSILVNIDSGFFAVTVTDLGANGCTATASAEVNQTLSPTMSFDLTHIEGDIKKGAVDMTVAGNNISSYQWIQLATSDTFNTEDINDLDEGIYVIQVEDINGCTAEDSVIIYSSDVALIKTLNTEPFTSKYGDTIEFIITFENQGNRPIDSIIIEDYIPSGFSFINETNVGGLNEGWFENDTNHVTHIWNNGVLNKGERDSISIYLMVLNSQNEQILNYNNNAELSGAKDIFGNWINDCDSELNDNDSDNGGSTVNTPSDNEWNGDGSSVIPGPIDSTDQDNADPAQLCVNDLALKMILSSHNGPYSPGDIATFDICIYNQGNVPTDSIIIVDYIPPGYVYSASHNLNGWVYDSVSRIASISINTGFKNGLYLEPGDSLCTQISLVVDNGNGALEDHINRAEISGAVFLKSKIISNDSGNYVNIIEKAFVNEDFDGLYDQIIDNDAGGNVNTESDNSIFGNGEGNPLDVDGTTDEDDHDPATILLARNGLGNQVWWDQNNDGLRANNEPGLDSVIVELFYINPVSGICEFVIRDTTDKNGIYQFENLVQGKYIVSLPSINFDINGSLYNFISSTGGGLNNLNFGNYENINNSISPENGIDNDDNGVLGLHSKDLGAVSSDTVLLFGNEPLNENPKGSSNSADSDDNSTVDFGFVSKQFDLALSKTLRYSDSLYRHGDQVLFNINIFNQGNVTASEFHIVDYIPKSLDVVSAAGNNGWSFSGDSLAHFIYSNPLEPGDSTSILINSIFVGGEEMSDYINIAEISFIADSSGRNSSNGLLIDKDSTPDSLKNNDQGGIVGGETDNYIYGIGNGPIGLDERDTDEDDADVALIKYADLALRKTLITTDYITENDEILFEITVYNQGNTDVKDILITDYVPSGLTLNDNNWMSINDSIAQFIINDTLKVGDSISVEIGMIPNETFSNSTVTNAAEISAFHLTNGLNATHFDVDSYGDSNKENDSGGMVNSISDDQIYENGKNGGDEDDHDPATVSFMDLALIKTYSGSGLPVQWGDTVEFSINIINQGTNPTIDILITDYMPEGMTFLSMNEPEWQLNQQNDPEYLYRDTLLPNQSFNASLFLKVDSNTQLRHLINFAEISDFKDIHGNKAPDIDSNPDNLDKNDGEVDDDKIQNENDDEDDHDIALIPIYDLALRKTVHSDRSEFYVGDVVTYMIEVINQGTMDATGVEIADKAQDGLEFLPDLNTDWKPKGEHFEYIPTVDVNAGDTSEIFITFRINSSANYNNVLNQAEIILTRGLGGTDLSDYDIDSKPDANFENDVGGLPGSSSDNEVNGIGIVDEDDADPAPLNLCGSLTCRGSINVSLDNSCLFSLNPSMLLLDTLPFTSNQFQIEYLDLHGNPINTVNVNDRIRVRISVPSCSGSSCETEVLIEDKIRPQIICNPVDTVSCDELNNLPTPEIIDLCNSDITLQLLEDEYQELCDNDTILAKIKRTYRALDAQGNVSDTCSSEIYVMSPNFNNTVFPSDTLISCDAITNSIEYLSNQLFGVPTLNGYDLTQDTMPICNISAYYEDQILLNTNCKKQILRTWTVNHWSCSSRDREIRMPQLITLEDTIAPLISLSDTLFITNESGADCMATFGLDGLSVVDNCDENVELQVFSDSIYTQFDRSTLTVTLPVDTHTIYIQATDECHNVRRDTVVVVIADNTPPLAICLSHKVVTLSNGSATLNAEDFDIASIDGCSPVTMEVRRMTSSCDSSDLQFRNEVSFCCNDIGQEVMVALRIMDGSDNYSICMISTTVQDSNPNPGCNTNAGLIVNITGKVLDLENAAMNSTILTLKDNNSLKEFTNRTDKQGAYSFDNMPTGGNYNLSPYKNNDWLNGVSTLDLIMIQGHLLGINPITNPYDLIAADINNDGTISAIDIVTLRKLILGISETITENTSWRFLWSGQELTSEFDLKKSLVESYSIPLLSENMDIDWKGIKIGDLSGNALSNNLQYSESRDRKRTTLEWDIAQEKENKIIHFYLPESMGLQGLQGKFSFPRSMIIEGFLDGQFDLQANNIHYNSSENSLTVSINFKTQKITDPTLPLFSFIIQDFENVNEDKIVMGTSITPEIYSNNSALTFGITRKNQILSESILLQNEPNPWTEKTTILFNSASDVDKLSLHIYDISGKVVYSQSHDAIKGINSFEIVNKDLSSEGVFLYEISIGDKKFSRKMLHLK